MNEPFLQILENILVYWLPEFQNRLAIFVGIFNQTDFNNLHKKVLKNWTFAICLRLFYIPVRTQQNAVASLYP